jgi:hypothetical protein
MVQKGIHHNPAQPGVKTGFTAKRPNRLERLEPDLLRKIFGVVRIPAIVHSHQVHSPGIYAGQSTKGFGIAGLSAFYQLFFADVCHQEDFPNVPGFQRTGE